MPSFVINAVCCIHRLNSPIVRQGAFASKGMAPFADSLSEEQAVQILTYMKYREYQDWLQAMNTEEAE